MKQILKLMLQFMVIFIIINGLTYLSITVGELNFDLTLWEKGTRFFYAIASLFQIAISIVVILIKD